MNNLKRRQEKVLKTIVQDYIRTGKPVASGKLVKCCGLKLSPASIRIIMAELEDLGYIWQPYTSAGRIPTDKGYRFYVDSLQSVPSPNKREVDDILSLTKLRAPSWDELIKRASELISEFTHYTSLVFTSSEENSHIYHFELISLEKKKILVVLVTDKIKIKNKIIPIKKNIDIADWNKWISNNLLGLTVEQAMDVLLNGFHLAKENNLLVKKLVEMLSEIKNLEDEPVYFTGDLNVFDQPELKEIDQIKSFFSLLDSKKRLVKILNPYLEKKEIQVIIGTENNFEELKNFSVIISPCRVSNDATVLLAVIGPKRMFYPRVISLMDFTSRILGRTLEGVL